MMVTQERFEQGMTFQQYLDQMGTNKETFTKFLSEIKIRPEDKDGLAKLGKKLKVMVITEDWCGDALYNVPVLAKLVEGNPNIELRVFLRDKNPDLMDQYLNKGHVPLHPRLRVLRREHERGRAAARAARRRSPSSSRRRCSRCAKALRAENLEQWRQDVVGEVRSLLKA